MKKALSSVVDKGRENCVKIRLLESNLQGGDYWELSIFMENQRYGYQIIESQRYGYQILESQRYGYQILESQRYGYRDIGIIKSEIFAIYGP